LIERGKNIDFKNKQLLTSNLKLKTYFGPFTNGTQLKEAMKIVRKIFPYLDNYSEKKTGYGFYREIGLAPEVESGEAKKDYQKTIANIKLFFKGKKKNILKNLQTEMKSLAKNHEFEKASGIKRTIFALNHIQDVALLKADSAKPGMESIFRIEAYDVAHISGTNTVGVMVVLSDGLADKNEYRKFNIKLSSQNDVAGLEEILRRRFNHPEWSFPNIIAVDGGIAQKNIAEKVLRENGLNIPVIAVTKNEKHRPESMQGKEDLINKYKREILLANNEAHRFAIKYHREKRSRIY
jgi:excinuclease ABC subunit C